MYYSLELGICEEICVVIRCLYLKIKRVVEIHQEIVAT